MKMKNLSRTKEDHIIIFKSVISRERLTISGRLRLEAKVIEYEDN
jgi:hypothetical protein